ncbi:hypothetical protein CR513_35804, partial [Mucuna pruriens]
MNRIFKDHIGNQFEVYVDDMMVKFKMEMKHAENLTSVLEVKAKKFLGFMLTKRGIEANPEKCNVVIGKRSPRSVKEVQ